MKKRIITSLVVAAIIAAGCGSTQPGAGYSYVDDIYYNPRTDPQKEEQKYFTERATLDKETQKVSDQELAQKQREYGNKQTPNQNTDFDAVQQNYANILANDSIIETDTLLYTNDETGYWVDGFEGSDMDRDYAERIVRFHGPFMGVPYGSPLYTDLVYGNYWDWNVYVDGNYAWAVPTWSNSLYYNYYSPGWSLSFGWGWPYYNSYGYWGGYYGYNSWYGMGYPYNGYYGGHHHGGYHNGYNGGGRNYTNEEPRRGNATNHSYTPNNTQYNNNPRESMKSTTTRTVDAQGNRTISNGQTTYTRPTRESYNQNAGTTTKSSSTDGGTQQVNDRAVRRSYTPTYSAPQNTSRPTYNRTAPSQQRTTTAPRSLGTGTSTGSTPAKSATQPTGTRYQSTGTSNSRPASSGTSSPSYSRPERSTSVSSPSSSSPSRSSGGYDNSGGSRSTSSPSSGGSSSGGGASRPSRR